MIIQIDLFVTLFKLTIYTLLKLILLLYLAFFNLLN